MSIKTEKIAIGTSEIPGGNLVLEVSGNVFISGLAGTGTRAVTVSADGSLGTGEITGGSGNVGVYGFFGDGGAGNVTLDSSITLSKDMNYNNLTIPSGVWLNTHGYILRVFGTLSVSSGGHIACDGSSGTNATGGTTAGQGGTGAYPRASSSASNLFFPFGAYPTNGGPGGYYPSTGTTLASGGTGGQSWNTTTAFTPYILRAGSGGGGGGGKGSGIPVGPSSGEFMPFVGGGYCMGGTGKTATGTGTVQAAGGGGGGGGGLLIIYANTIDNQGIIHANGGNGGNGYNAGVGNTGGGGAGGGGGIIIIYYRNLTGAGIGTRQVNGGTSGANGTGGSSAQSGLLISYRI